MPFLTPERALYILGAAYFQSGQNAKVGHGMESGTFTISLLLRSDGGPTTNKGDLDGGGRL